MRENNVQEYLEDSSSFNIDEQVNKDSFLKNDKFFHIPLAKNKNMIYYIV